MKWLILLALVASCGKHTEPKALDYKDSDGDQIQNYKETEFDKYVANFETLGDVKGVIRFNADKLYEIKFTNQHNLDASTLELMTGNYAKLKQQEYFSEWSNVVLEDKAEVPSLKQAQYTISFELVSGSDKPDEILLVTGKESLNLGIWEENKTATLSSNDLNALINGSAKLVLVKKFKPKMKFFDETDITIKEKTYRVYYHDGKESKIFYVSKDLEFGNFLKMKEIYKHVSVTEDDFFFKSWELDETNWYTRNLANGDKVVAKSKLSKLREKFKENYTIQKKVISRINGNIVSTLDLNNKPGAKVYLRIRSLTQTVRTFAANNRTYQVGGGGGGREGNSSGRVTCHSFQTLVADESQKKPDLDQVVNQFNHPEIFDQGLSGIPSESGLFWELKAISPAENMRLALNNLPESTYVQTGEYRNNCNPEARGQRTNTEGKLSLEVESYVEKI